MFDASLKDEPVLLGELRGTLAQRFALHHVTLQIERTPCEQEHEGHTFAMPPDAGAAEENHAGHPH